MAQQDNPEDAAQAVYMAFQGVFSATPANAMQLVKFASHYKNLPNLTVGQAQAVFLANQIVVDTSDSGQTSQTEEKSVAVNFQVGEFVNLKKMTPIDEFVDTLPEFCENNPGFQDILVGSLVKANDEAVKTMAPQVYEDYGEVFGWPVTFEQYMDFLKKTGKWIPHQSPYVGWQKIVKDQSGTIETNYLEVLAMLCHFSYLIDQEVGPEKVVPAKNENFDAWIAEFSRLWGEFLDTPESFNNDILQTYITYSPIFKMEQFLFSNYPGQPRNKPNNPSNWMTFNQFFARQVISGYRPVAQPETNLVISCPSDFTLVQNSENYRPQIFQINDQGQVLSPTTGGATAEFVVKGTKIIGKVSDILDDSKYADRFNGGTLSNYFLSTYDLHRFSSPVSGVVLENRAVQGKVYVNITLDNNGLSAFPFNAPVDARTGFQFDQTRGIFIIDTSQSPYGDIGLVAVCPIGLSQVSGVNMTVPVGNTLLKGDEFGYFQFGGSDMIILFSNPNIRILPEIDPTSNMCKHRLSGSKLAEFLIID